MSWSVYLSGEIHTDWREVIQEGTEARGLPVRFSAPVTDHGASDDCGVAILGAEEKKFWQSIAVHGQSSGSRKVPTGRPKVKLTAFVGAPRRLEGLRLRPNCISEVNPRSLSPTTSLVSSA